MAVDMQYFVLTPILLTIFWMKPSAGYLTSLVLLGAGTASQIIFTVKDDEFFHGSFGFYVKPWNRSQPYVIGLLTGYLLHRMRDTKVLKINTYMSMFIWGLMTALASTVLYGVSYWNIVEDVRVALPCPPCNPDCHHPPILARALYNGFARIAWGLSIGWVIVACVKGRGGLVDSILSWSGWVPLARVQYCVYLLHRTVIYILNSWSEAAVRYTHTHFAIQSISIVAISTAVAFVFVILFEAPIVQMEKLLFASIGLSKMPQKRKD